MISLYFFIIVIIGVFVFFRKRSADLYKFSRAYRDYRYNIEINIKKAIVTISANMICFVLRNENSGLEDEHLFLQFKMTDRSTEKVLVGKLVDFDWQIRVRISFYKRFFRLEKLFYFYKILFLVYDQMYFVGKTIHVLCKN